MVVEAKKKSVYLSHISEYRVDVKILSKTKFLYINTWLANSRPINKRPVLQVVHDGAVCGNRLKL